MTPESVKKFIKVFSSLPSIGPRQATRLAFYLVGLGKASLSDVSDAVASLQELKRCPDCFFICQERCPICSDMNRRQDIVAVLEKETDLISLEQAKKYDGVYLVLGELDKTGILNPEQKLKIAHLKSRGPFTEIVLAINPTTYGDLNASLLFQELRASAQKITRLGRGIPTGGEIEFADEDTLGSAIDHRS